MATTQAAVTTEVPGVVKLGLGQVNNPTPEWVRRFVRALTWLTAIYAFLSLQLDLTDFGVSEKAENLILKYSASLTGLVSLVARFIGVEPVNFMYNAKHNVAR